MSEIVTLSHGAGGTAMRGMIRDLFLRYFKHPALHELNDAALLDMPGHRVAFTTDSYVVQPIEFPGGNLGKLAICGTVNDLAVMGAKPLYLSAGFILEEGLSFKLLEKMIHSMAIAASEAGVEIVNGDTKVVPRGECDKMFINTSGIGICPLAKGLCTEAVAAEDVVIVSGTIGEHGIAVLSGRGGLQFESSIVSDCASLNGMIEQVLTASSGVKWMRDATRGGVAAVLSELVEQCNVGLLVEEQRIPVRPDVVAVCELLGFDPLHLANEGKVVAVVKADEADRVLTAMREHPFGRNAQSIGTVTSEGAGNVRVRTLSGGIRRLHRPAGELLPRIC